MPQPSFTEMGKSSMKGTSDLDQGHKPEQKGKGHARKKEMSDVMDIDKAVEKDDKVCFHLLLQPDSFRIAKSNSCHRSHRSATLKPHICVR